MNHTTIIAAVGLALAAVLSAAPAQALGLNQHSFVSSQGLDTNNCTLAAPCRHLQAALAATIAGGEIAILDTAGYNNATTVTISQAVSIVNPGGFEAEISPPWGGIGIVISAGTNDAVSLRGLSIDGAGVGATGIKFNAGASLTVENCIIRHVTGDGIDFYSTTATSALTVSNSLVADNSGIGIVLQPIGSATAVFNRVEANNNGSHGIMVDGTNSAGTNTINATVSESVAAGNSGGAGFFSVSNSGKAPTSLMVYHSVAANNSDGVAAAGPGATLRLANSTVTGNGNGWAVPTAGGVLYSYGDNYIDGNVSGESAPPSIARK